jgi:hypothetical protein
VLDGCWAFVAMLGENYGAVLGRGQADELSDKTGFEWVGACAGRSFTEVEMAAGFRFMYSSDTTRLRHGLVGVRETDGMNSTEDATRWLRQKQLVEDVQVHRGLHAFAYEAPSEFLAAVDERLARYASYPPPLLPLSPTRVPTVTSTPASLFA